MRSNPYAASNDVDGSVGPDDANSFRRLSVRESTALTLLGIAMIGACSLAIYVLLASGYGFDLPGGYRPPNSDRFRRTLGIAAWGATGFALLSFSCAAYYGRGRSRIPAGAFSVIILGLISWGVLVELLGY